MLAASWYHPEYLGEHRIVPEEWERRLFTLIPPSRTKSWLLPRWEMGNPWEPINRWIVWHMQPLAALANRPDTLTELMGPRPRSTGHYCAKDMCPCVRKKDRWVGGSAFSIDQQQWDLFQEYKLYATRWWIVQGTNGGHRYRLSPSEARLSELQGNGWSPPDPGELPYADFDWRAFRKIAAFGEWQTLEAIASWCREHPEQMDQWDAAAEREANKIMWHWLGEQVYTTRNQLSRIERQALVEARPIGVGRDVLTDRHVDYEGIERDFLEAVR